MKRLILAQGFCLGRAVSVGSRIWLIVCVESFFEGAENMLFMCFFSNFGGFCTRDGWGIVNLDVIDHMSYEIGNVINHVSWEHFNNEKEVKQM